MNNEKMREKAMWGVIAWVADENIGMYPAAVHGGPKPYEQRTDFMNGWNSCALTRSRNEAKIADWLDKLPVEYKTLVEDLLIEAKLDIHVRGGDVDSVEDEKKPVEIVFLVNCNDLFWWATSDCEPITLEELPQLAKDYETSEKYGDWIWCARKRQMRPQWPAVYKYMVPAGAWTVEMDALPLREDKGDHGWNSKDAKEFVQNRLQEKTL